MPTTKPSSRKPRKYGKASQKEVEKEMRKFKKGTAHSGPKRKKSKESKASHSNRPIKSSGKRC